MKKESKFNLKSFTSFTLVISTIIMSWSVFILYLAPPGRITNWGTWKLKLFTKAEWQALHTIFSHLFFILVIIHLFFVNCVQVTNEVPEGIGKYRVESTARIYGKDPELLLQLLKSKGIETTREMTLRAITDQHGETPREAY
jgi:hypothetical protein